MTIIEVAERAGSFAENKDVARSLRMDAIEPALEGGDDITVDFGGVELATQSFVHALISSVIRRHGSQVLDRISFANCTEAVRGVVEIVVEYSQDDVAST